MSRWLARPVPGRRTPGGSAARQHSRSWGGVVPGPLGPPGRVGMGRVPDAPVGRLLPVEPEPGLGGGSADDERQRDRLAPLGRVVGVDSYVAVRVGPAALVDL